MGESISDDSHYATDALNVELQKSSNMCANSSSSFSNNSNLRNMDVVSKPFHIHGQAVCCSKTKEVEQFSENTTKKMISNIEKSEKTKDTSAFDSNISLETTKTQHSEQTATSETTFIYSYKEKLYLDTLHKKQTKAADGFSSNIPVSPASSRT